jgi:epoxyqueuosine reductase QueG
MAATAPLTLSSAASGDQLCDACGLCIPECPAQAISADAFQGLKCRAYRKARGEYEPHGPEGLLPYCKRCLWICPKGERPVPRGEIPH